MGKIQRECGSLERLQSVAIDTARPARGATASGCAIGRNLSSTAAKQNRKNENDRLSEDQKTSHRSSRRSGDGRSFGKFVSACERFRH
jgi:hypothetical protein